jgi:hypothetical protein
MLGRVLMLDPANITEMQQWIINVCYMSELERYATKSSLQSYAFLTPLMSLYVG